MLAADREDGFDAFSVQTMESELNALENVLDLKIETITYEQQFMGTILDQKITNPNQIKTVATFDFFVNRTVPTEVQTGFNPRVNQVICFKNVVDDFYLNFIAKEFILVEFYSVKGH